MEMRNRTTKASGILFVVIIIVLSSTPLLAQHEPYITHDTRPLITEGPFLVAPTQDGISIVWKTDTDCHSRVEYGKSDELGNIAEVFRQGFLPVGTTHAIRLSGLTPGKTYNYKAVSTRVVKLKAYWPEKGLSIESKVGKFTVPDPKNKTVTFSFVTDTQHEDLPRIAKNLDIVNWEDIDFLAHGGDAFGAIESEDQFFAKFLRPMTERLENKPLVFVRGNHDLRGPFARRLYDYLPTQSGEFYYSFDAGPVHFLVLDTGEDKDDDTNVYAGLNRTEPYREQEFGWLQKHVKTNQSIKTAPFRIILMHAPKWGWVDGQNDKWTDLANRAGVDLVVAGHHHRYSWTPAGTDARNYGVLVVGQDQAAHVEASATKIKIVVTDTSRNVISEISVPRRN
jgi:predicted phosphodiesterase